MDKNNQESDIFEPVKQILSLLFILLIVYGYTLTLKPIY